MVTVVAPSSALLRMSSLVIGSMPMVTTGAVVSGGVFAPTPVASVVEKMAGSLSSIRLKPGVPSPFVWKPIVGSTRCAVSLSITVLWPPPAAPPPPPAPGPAAVGSRPTVGSRPAANACSNSLRGACAVLSEPSCVSGLPACQELFAPSCTVSPFAISRVTEPPSAVVTSSPAKMRSPSNTWRFKPSTEVTKTWPINDLMTAAKLLINSSMRGREVNRMKCVYTEFIADAAEKLASYIWRYLFMFLEVRQTIDPSGPIINNRIT
ncbi:hypothetical protein SRABI70_01695 [Pseudomonas sp. Bi70]|nr:hypothetical protein SRABI70_01695 [Pseudomonas sp. Bi70]